MSRKLLPFRKNEQEQEEQEETEEESYKEVKQQVRREPERKTDVQIMERAINLELINDKLNYIIEVLNKIAAAAEIDLAR